MCVYVWVHVFVSVMCVATTDPLAWSYTLLHGATSLLGKTLECSQLSISSGSGTHLDVSKVAARGWPASCSVSELAALPALLCRTGVCLGNAVTDSGRFRAPAELILTPACAGHPCLQQRAAVWGLVPGWG